MFKYLGELIQVSELVTVVNKARARKMVQAYHPKDVYNKNNISIKTKIRHYNPVMK